MNPPTEPPVIVTRDPDELDTLAFIIAVEDGSITAEQLYASAQRFVDSGIWRQLQGSWQRTVHAWAESGVVNL